MRVDEIVGLDDKETPTTTLGSNTGFLGENPTRKGNSRTSYGNFLCTRVFTHVVGVSNDVGRYYSWQVTDIDTFDGYQVTDFDILQVTSFDIFGRGILDKKALKQLFWIKEVEYGY